MLALIFVSGGAVVGSADLTGVAFTETQIVAGAQVTTVTLNNDTWAASGATFNAQRQNIIDGFDSAQSEATGWNAEVRDKEVVTAIVRTSDTVVTVTWTASASYDITAGETITLTIPATAVAGSLQIIANQTIAISETASADLVSFGVLSLMQSRGASVTSAIESTFSISSNLEE